MSDFFRNEIVQGVLVTLIGVLILGIIGWLKFKRDEKIVTEFLKNSGIETRHTFRATDAISSATNLSEERSEGQTRLADIDRIGEEHA
jgi:hypothetical protein